MKTAIAGTWVYATVLIFMVVLIAYVTITINYSNAYEISENIIKAIEEYEGVNDKSLNRIDSLLNNTHTVKNSCGSVRLSGNASKMYGINSENGERIKPATGGEKFSVCVYRTDNMTNGVKKYYYNTTIFFSFSLPVLGDLFSFKIPGETMGMRYVNDKVTEW